MAHAPQAKHWAGCTLNNYTDADLLRWESHIKPIATYYVSGKEVGDGGTPHLQFMVCFKTQKRLSAVIKLFITHGHWEMKSKNSTFAEASDYCKKGEQTHAEWLLMGKDGPHWGLNADFIEYGVLPRNQHEAGAEAMQEKFDSAFENAKTGDFDLISAEMKLKYYTTLKKIYTDNRAIPKDLDWKDGETPNEWIWGPTGTGKSRKARLENPGFYLKMTKNTWWENYDDEEVVLIEDIDVFDIKLGGELKIWGDRYGFRSNQKFSSVVLRPKKIVITSNYQIREIWSDPQTYEALERRFKQIYLGPTDIVGRIPTRNLGLAYGELIDVPLPTNDDVVLAEAAHEIEDFRIEIMGGFMEDDIDLLDRNQ